MKKPSKDLRKEIDHFFSAPPSASEKAWDMILDFYHNILTYMEENNISQADLARKLNKSRSAVSQMLSKTPNITVKKMVEIADAVGLDFTIIPKNILQKIEKQQSTMILKMDTWSRLVEQRSMHNTIRIEKDIKGLNDMHDTNNVSAETSQKYMYSA